MLVGIHPNPGPRGKRGGSGSTSRLEEKSDQNVSGRNGIPRPISNVNWLALDAAFPPRLFTKNKYTAMIDLANAAVTAQSYLFNMNSTFDPDRTGVGHQPEGRDTLSTVYARYRVHKCDWQIEVAPSVAQIFAVVPQNHLTTYTDVTDAMEQPWSKKQSGSTTTNILRFRGSSWLHRVNGQTMEQYSANEDVAAVVGSNPGEIICLCICGQNFGATTTFTACSISVTIWYYTEWYDRVHLAQS